MSLVIHHCFTDPEAGFPSGLPDVGTAGTTWDAQRNVIGPWFHDCRTCGERYQWRESVGFVVWRPVTEVNVFDRDARAAHGARIAAATPSATEEARGW